jgi:hypothetical protein
MADNLFDPQKFIDREFEQELFEDLLKFEESARILAIRDKGGMGKSHLLERFQYRCRTVKPRTPISLIALDQLPDNSPHSLVKLMAEHLDRFRLKFDNFTKYENARQSANFSLISSSIYLQSANFAGASDLTIAGSAFRDVNNVNVVGSYSSLNTDQEKTAREVVVDSFFDDLQKYCSKQPIVIILDSYEKCNPSLQKWIVTHFLEKYFLGAIDISSQLVLVIAGRELPNFYNAWPSDDCDKLVKSINELHKWRKEHVEECLRVHGLIYEQSDLDYFYKLIERGKPPSEIIQLMQTILDPK